MVQLELMPVAILVYLSTSRNLRHVGVESDATQANRARQKPLDDIAMTRKEKDK